MQIQKTINIQFFLVLTLLNILLAFYSFGLENKSSVVFFIAGILLNQYMLYAGLQLLLIKKAKSFKASMLLVGKFVVLVFIFIVTMQQFPTKLPTLVFCYTFQLIILTLSIKRKAAKN